MNSTGHLPFPIDNSIYKLSFLSASHVRFQENTHLEQWWSFAEVWLDLLLHIAPPSDISDVEMIDEDVAATFRQRFEKGEMQKSYDVLCRCVLGF